MSDVLARRLQRWIFFDRVAVALGRRDGLVQMIGFLNFAHARSRRLGASHVVEDFAHQPLGDARRAFKQTLDLLLDAVAQVFGVEILGQCLVREGIEEGERYPPKGALRSRTLYRLDRIDGGAHFFGPPDIVLEPLEKSALVAAALLPQALARFGPLRCSPSLVTLGRAESEIRIVEICRIGMP